MFDANDPQYTRPKNFTQARQFAKEYGFIIRRDHDWQVIKVYDKDLSFRDLAAGVGVYETRFEDFNDAWDTMLSMWRAKNSLAKNQPKE